MVVKRVIPELPKSASHRLKRRQDMPPVHEQLDALWSSFASMQMRGLTIPAGTEIITDENELITLAKDTTIPFDLPQPMDDMIGKINGVRRKHPKEVKEVKQGHIDEITGKGYKTASALKAAITRRENRAKKKAKESPQTQAKAITSKISAPKKPAKTKAESAAKKKK